MLYLKYRADGILSLHMAVISVWVQGAHERHAILTNRAHMCLTSCSFGFFDSFGLHTLRTHKTSNKRYICILTEHTWCAWFAGFASRASLGSQAVQAVQAVQACSERKDFRRSWRA